MSERKFNVTLKMTERDREHARPDPYEMVRTPFSQLTPFVENLPVSRESANCSKTTENRSKLEKHWKLKKRSDGRDPTGFHIDPSRIDRMSTLSCEKTDDRTRSISTVVGQSKVGKIRFSRSRGLAET